MKTVYQLMLTDEPYWVCEYCPQPHHMDEEACTSGWWGEGIEGGGGKYLLVNRITHILQNITFPQLFLQTLKIDFLSGVKQFIWKFYAKEQ